ncbi:MAG: hypothetical protein HY301_16495 [Verrucomicrobia bacterium]|nr:hypothetical protein [Verrucomicrobiota bacterium]
MATCYKCSGEIEFYHNGFNAVPIHVSGSCSASGGSSGYRSGLGWIERETESGQRFVFGWVEYPSYVNPNATCPRCGKSVYFYQSPFGGRVYFNELGPPWPKHGPSPWECPDEEDELSRTARITPSVFHPSIQTEKSEAKTIHRKTILTTPEWRKAGWNPLILSKAEATGSGILIDGNELLENSKNIELNLLQVEIQDTFQEARGELMFSYSMTMNPNRLISALTGNVVFIRRVTETIYELSTVSITTDDELIHFTFRMKSF